MNKIMCVLRDNASRSWIVPIMAVASVEVMQRDLTEFLNTKSETPAPAQKYPEDFEVWQIGTFDDESGIAQAFSVPERLFRLSDLVRRPS